MILTLTVVSYIVMVNAGITEVMCHMYIIVKTDDNTGVAVHIVSHVTGNKIK
jgi:hypothetical protein